ncbi:MAG: hypothetical protein JXA21_14615 [Anaerolineae bacterium]|nr:hypothetical protein [Anaerolineae bacterium]
MNETVQSKPIKTTHWTRHLIFYALLPLAAFLIGFIPMWMKSREYSRQLLDVEQQLSLTRLNNTLTSAAIDARRGDYETARQAASDFFTSLRTETDKETTLVFSVAQKERLQPLLTQRDEIITLLARGDPAAADQLSDLYVTYREAISR